MEAATGKVLFSDYTRHHSDQLQSVSRAVKLVKETLAGRSFLMAMTGSGAKHLSEELEIPYVQEVVANSIALKAMYGEIGTAIELGGQDAKIIFFQRDKRTGELQVADMRMNGSCAGGTGAFVDEIASLLKKRGAGRIYICSTFGLFTDGLDKFDEGFKNGVFDKLLTTNLVYQTPELLEKPYYITCDMSKYIALIIDTLNHDMSVSHLLNPVDRIKRCVSNYMDQYK